MTESAREMLGRFGNAEHGYREAALPNVILRTTVGSGVHGVAIEGTDDHDEMAVYIEPPEYVIGTAGRLGEDDEGSHGAPHYIARTKPEGHRSGPGDVDLVAYSLRRYVRLAAKGNPTALLPLWAPQSDVLWSTDLGEALRGIRPAFMSQEAVLRFLGYMDAQHERMMGGGRQGRVPNRPELVAKHGYDTKYAAHALRLAYEGLEVATRGTLTLPMPGASRDEVLAVRRGERTRDEVSVLIEDLTAKVHEALANNRTLPYTADWATIGRFTHYAHLTHWGYEPT